MRIKSAITKFLPIDKYKEKETLFFKWRKTMEHRSEIFQKIHILSQKYGITVNKKEIYKIFNILDRLPEVRHRKMAKIKKAINTGKYQVPAEKVASAILKDSLKFEYLITQQNSANILLQLLKILPPGKEYCYIFHKLGSICVSDIFQDELSSPLFEMRGSKGHKRYDLILYNRAQNGFWSDMKRHHKISHVVFEFKNWGKSIYRQFSQQISDYSEKNRAVILVTRNKPDENIFFELSTIYKKIDNFLPLPISLTDLYIASTLKLEESSPSQIFEAPYLRLQSA